MTEDIVERLRIVSDKAFGPDGFPLLTEAANEIERLSAQLATSHNLSFKAGIEAAAGIIASGAPETSGPDYGMASEDERREMRNRRDERYRLADLISSLPTPPSPLPEILEAMRPIAEIVSKDIGEDESNADLFRNMHAFNKAPLLTVGHLRAIAAVFTNLGGTHD